MRRRIVSDGWELRRDTFMGPMCIYGCAEEWYFVYDKLLFLLMS